MRTTISILGCGWLGTALGKNLLQKGYIVKGSTGTNDRLNELEFTGIQPFYIRIEPELIDIDYFSFFNTDVLVIAIPPKRVENITEIFPGQIKKIIELIRQMKIPKVLFISSTSVYEPANKEVREGDEGNPDKPSGRAILKAEKMLLNETGFQTTVVRFGGLIGANRNPGRFMAGKKNVPANTPVNLIHRDDCVSILSQIIEKDIWGEVFNACSPEHPTKKEFYTKAAEVSDLPAPEFTEVQENYKIINSDKLVQRLGYTFKYPSPMVYLKELQEWDYRI
jgi:nucleoside-diphosphate-sugar epimerase